jgi:selenide, water dikinase
MAEGSGLSAEIGYAAIPILDSCREYLAQKIMPDATYRNWNSYSSKVAFEPGVNVMEAFNILPDPQTNGGLLVAVEESSAGEMIAILEQYQIPYTAPIGKLVRQTGKVITVKN